MSLEKLRSILASCSQSFESGDFSESEKSIAELVQFLNVISDSVANEPENEESEGIAFEIVTEIYKLISSDSLDQAGMDALSFELPKSVARFAIASRRCLEVVEGVINRFMETCSPRDMLSVLCDALGSPGEMFESTGYFAPLLTGLAKGFVSIQRRQFEQVKAAVPVILNVLKVVSVKTDYEDENLEELFDRTVDVASSIQAICFQLDSKDCKRLQSLFGLFLLQMMALVSVAMANKVSSCTSLVVKFSSFLHYCGLSYTDLIVGFDLDTAMKNSVGDDEDDYRICFSDVKQGAALAVIWGFKSPEVCAAAKGDLTAVKDKLQAEQTTRWQALGTLKYIFTSVNLPWELKKHAIEFLDNIMSGVSMRHNDEQSDYSTSMPTLLTALQAIQMVIMYAPDPELRKSAFSIFKKVLADIPSSVRFDILSALVRVSDSSSMIAILLDCIRGEMLTESSKSTSTSNGVLQTENRGSQCASFWSAGVLELVELVLRPPKGGPPSLPEYSDAVLSALNLYRFLLMKERTGKTNHTGVLLKENLQKAYNEWLLPLRTLVTGIMTENQKDCDELACLSVCALNPVEFVLYHCIELVEENLKAS